MAVTPAGREREVKFLGGASIDGAPVAYIVVLAAVLCALAFIPFSVVLASGGSFPVSQGVFALVGWILGPIAGAVAAGVGALLGVFLAPHTAGVPVVTVYGGMIASFSAGVMVLGAKRKTWWIGIAVLALIAFAIYAGRALVVNGVPLGIAVAELLSIETAIILWILPTRTLIARLIHDQNIAKVAAGLFVGTWMCWGLANVCQAAVTYMMFNWPTEVWVTLIPIVPMETLFRSLIGMVIGTGVIAGLRAIGLVKPETSLY